MELIHTAIHQYKVFDPSPDEDTRGIIEFTNLLFGDSSLFSTILPIRDGVAAGYKL